ncbi:DUF6402 family protein [Pseudomonas japonica]|uniref:Uncharacterized protein n=1 Tax=Pseudomonas japonica TaxID=256466 RepID=A0A239G185_9PSED|nr:DUF6402 family protein [Pseudomonas japonica]SNS62233.1 hypothetical protein SAMN05444352_11170 [Pseudomonas japonica]
MSLKDFQQTTALGPDALFLLENATLDTRPGRYHEPKQIVINALPLTKVPVAMRKMGWHTSAALMQRWFDSPGWQMPETWKNEKDQPAALGISRFQCEENIVKMDWAMSFRRCQEAVAVAESRITTPNAIDRLKKLLENAGWQQIGMTQLGSTSFSAREIDTFSQVNFAELGDLLDTLDDMYGALGQATVKVGVVGRTFSKEDPFTKIIRNHFRIEYLGFYIRDNYDFNGPQFLGIWALDRVMKKSETPVATLASMGSLFSAGENQIALVTNGDFRNYRGKTGMGGDFVIYSDVLWKKVDQVIDLGPPI